MATQAERRAATRARLIDTAWEQFARLGFENTHTEEILREAGISRGAMYHHYKSKQELFEAVFVEASRASIERAMAMSTTSTSPVEVLMETCLNWMRVMRRPELATIILEQGPQVLGWQRARELEGKLSMGPMKQGLKRAVEVGEITVSSLDLTARLLNALLAEAALAERYADPAVRRKDQVAAIRQFVLGLRSTS